MPDLKSCLAYIRGLGKQRTVDILETAVLSGRPAVQPRCGVGSHQGMLTLLQGIERQAGPEILTLTIDSHTRLLRFCEAERILRDDPTRLNGYPLIAHGWERGREINEAIKAPLEVRHGSPVAEDLFVATIASGITSFEGGGISYNIPYAKDVPLENSLRSWRAVDRACGELAREGIVVERELFGTLTAVLIPPSVSIAISILEAVSAAREGVTCISIAYPQGGNSVQDVAALRSIPVLADRYVGAEVATYPVLHQFMGVFPREPARADALILLGGLVAKWGRAAKVIAKTNREAHGIPDLAANVKGLQATRVAVSDYLGDFGVDEEAVAEEMSWICREVEELVEPILLGGDVAQGISQAFLEGRLDVPFSASIHAHSKVTPRRDPSGAIRFANPGGLPFSRAILRRNDRLLNSEDRTLANFIEEVTGDIEYFSTHMRKPRRSVRPDARISFK